MYKQYSAHQSSKITSWHRFNAGVISNPILHVRNKRPGACLASASHYKAAAPPRYLSRAYVAYKQDRVAHSVHTATMCARFEKRPTATGGTPRYTHTHTHKQEAARQKKRRGRPSNVTRLSLRQSHRQSNTTTSPEDRMNENLNQSRSGRTGSEKTTARRRSNLKRAF